MRSGPLVGKVATSPLPSQGSPPLQSGGGESEVAHLWAKWLCHPRRLKDPHRFRAGGGKSEVAHLWAKWLPHPCGIGDPQRFKAGGEIRSGPLVGKVATSPLPSRGSPPLQSGGGKSEVAHLWAKWLYHPRRLKDPHRFRAGGGGSEVAHLWAKWLPHPCGIGDPQRFKAGGEIRSGPLVGKVATSPLPSRGSPPLQRGGEIRSGPLVGKVATSPLPSRGSPPLQSGGGGSEVAHLWAKWVRHPCRLGDPHRFRAGCKIRSGPLVGKVAMSPLPSQGSPPLQSGGGNQKWPTCGQSGYVTLAVSRIPTVVERGAKSEMAHLWAKWLRQPCRLGDPHRCRAGGKIRSGPLVGKVATSSLPCRRSPPLQSGGGKSEVAHL